MVCKVRGVGEFLINSLRPYLYSMWDFDFSQYLTPNTIELVVWSNG
jgi:hypothetical protein